jgi:hypothetical protein
MWVRVPPILPTKNYVMNSEERYLEEFKKYKDVKLHLDSIYCKKSKLTEKVVILRITCAGMAQIKNLKYSVQDTSLVSKKLSIRRINKIKNFH